MSVMISLPATLSAFAEQEWIRLGIKVECFSSGAGSDEYEFATEAEATRAIEAVRKAVEATLDNCVVVRPG